jgi:hypothetical protein
MAQMGRYCKAYPLDRVAAFTGWTAAAGASAAGGEAGDDNEIVFVQEDLAVTRGIYRDEDVLFDVVTPEWKEFCERVLKFAVPDYLDDDESPSRD